MQPWDKWINQSTDVFGRSAIQTMKRNAASGDVQAKMDLQSLEENAKNYAQKELSRKAAKQGKIVSY